MRFTCALLLLSFTLTACQHLPSIYEEPKVSLAGLELGEVKGFKLPLTLVLLIENPNSYALELDQLSYRVVLQDVEIAHGSSTDPVAIAAGQQSRFKVPVTVNMLSGLNLVAALVSADSEALNYRLDIEFDLQSPPFGLMQVSREAAIRP